MKANVLLNYYNFDGDWAKNTLSPLLYGKKTLIIPLAYREKDVFDNDSWQSLYGTHGEKYQNITAPFVAYNMPVDWLNYFDNRDKLAQIADADVLFFCGGMPEKAIARMQELGITDAVKHFNGIVMGASAGAMLQLETYHVTPDEDYNSYGVWNGLGLVRGLDLEVHFLDTDLQNQCTARAIMDLGLSVYQMWHEGGLLIVDGKVTPMGQVRLVTKQL